VILTINLLEFYVQQKTSTTKKVVYFEKTTLINTQRTNAHRGTVLLLPEDGVHNHRNTNEQEYVQEETR